jgi:hypothetical protein
MHEIERVGRFLRASYTSKILSDLHPNHNANRFAISCPWQLPQCGHEMRTCDLQQIAHEIAPV